jgi:16S rRNA (guanine1207-N2)-methyltransferase
MTASRARDDLVPEPLRAAVATAVELIGAGRGEVIVYGAVDRGLLAERLLRSGAASRVTVVAVDAAAIEAVRERAQHAGGRLEAVVGRSPAEAGGSPVDAVVVVASGYEGHAHLRGVIEQAAVRLSAGGELFVVAGARTGGNALARFVREVFGEVETVRARSGVRVLRARRGAAGVPDPARPEEERFSVEIGGRTFEFATEAGVFSRGRLDAGTRLLIESVEVGGARDLLDLGCGYGPIGIVLAALHPHLGAVLADVDARAVALARRNAEANGVAGRVEAVVATGPAALGRRFDLAVSHFPLHVPRGLREELVRQVFAVLAPGGRFSTVALAQYDLRPALEAVFPSVRLVADTTAAVDPSSRYVVLEARR